MVRRVIAHAVDKATDNAKVKEHARGKGPGQTRARAPLAAAFEAVDRFPVLVESRQGCMSAATAETPAVGELAEAVESDVALTIAVMRAADRAAAPGGVGGSQAVEVAKPAGVRAIADEVATYDPSRPTHLAADARSASAPRPGDPSRRRADRRAVGRPPATSWRWRPSFTTWGAS